MLLTKILTYCAFKTLFLLLRPSRTVLHHWQSETGPVFAGC